MEKACMGNRGISYLRKACVPMGSRRVICLSQCADPAMTSPRFFRKNVASKLNAMMFAWATIAL
jgi:hypothetical protein